MGTATTPRLVLGVLAGLGGGLLLSAGTLVWMGLRALAQPCPWTSLTECAFHHETQVELSHFMLLAAAGTGIAGAGVLLWLYADSKTKKAP